MKKINLILVVFSILITSCNSNYNFDKDFNCNVSTPNNLEEISDFKNNFVIELPKNWKTNLYYDDAVSSVYSADTTKSLTNSIILDASFVLNPIKIDDAFIEKIKKENLKMELIELKSKKIRFNEGEGYYNLTKGKQGKFDYHVLNVFSKAERGFLHAKTEIYGDSLVNKRICTALKLIEKIHLK